MRLPKIPPLTSEITDASYLLRELDDMVDDGAGEATCADPLDAGEQAVDVRVPEVSRSAVATIHLRCYQGEGVVA